MVIMMGKRKSSELWRQERHRDQFYKMAKAYGYRSRASYKLLEVIKKYRFIKSGDRVIDIGAAPGGWLQATRYIVRDTGFVFGFDLEPIKPLPYKNVLTKVLDITDERASEKIIELTGGNVDVLLSDISPNISGIWEVDTARQNFLALRSFEIALKLLHLGGNFFVKLFQGQEFTDFKIHLRKYFERIRIIKPSASRARSSEVYLLGTFLLKSS